METRIQNTTRVQITWCRRRRRPCALNDAMWQIKKRRRDNTHLIRIVHERLGGVMHHDVGVPASPLRNASYHCREHHKTCEAVHRFAGDGASVPWITSRMCWLILSIKASGGMSEKSPLRSFCQAMPCEGNMMLPASSNIIRPKLVMKHEGEWLMTKGRRDIRIKNLHPVIQPT